MDTHRNGLYGINYLISMYSPFAHTHTKYERRGGAGKRN